MKIYISHSSDSDYRNGLYKPIRASRLNSQHEIFLPHEQEHKNTKTVIESSEIVIAEVSFPSTGEGIELGWANSAGVPVVCVHQMEAKLSRSLEAVSKSFLAYSDPEDLINKIEEALENTEL